MRNRKTTPLDPSRFRVEVLLDLGMQLVTPSSKRKRRIIRIKCSNCNNVSDHIIDKFQDSNRTVCTDCSGKGGGIVTHGDSKSALYLSWIRMKSRCANTTSEKTLRSYGDKDIGISDEWDDYSVFKLWALSNGYTKGKSLDRRDNDGNYTPENCRWVTMSIQARNTRRIQSNNTSGYRGVTKAGSKWIAQITVDSERKYLGIYTTPELAAKAYDSYVSLHSLEHTRNGVL